MRAKSLPRYMGKEEFCCGISCGTFAGNIQGQGISPTFTELPAERPQERYYLGVKICRKPISCEFVNRFRRQIHRKIESFL
ncbi:hypothetical protein MTR_6g017115 [Medicago truncatula]|uniref:Uncharacterized protein n=1 Tax=Medicago truncatula TaxID=3880 RepID=A0A072UHP2_MEDTR|nr:hypothetical protein MTR_6g017115 [Medicago truncatula]